MKTFRDESKLVRLIKHFINILISLRRNEYIVLIYSVISLLSNELV